MTILALAALAGGFDPGPPLGTKAAAFEAPDQDGRMRSFEDLRGPNGLALLFHRSADW